MKFDLKAISAKRVLMSVLGVLVCGFSVGIFKIAAFGVDPFQTLMAGLDHWIPISFGTLYVIVNVVLLSFSLIFDRTRIGLGTFINLFLTGYAAEFSLWLMQQWLGTPSLVVRAICLVIAVIIMCFASSFYMTADLGVSTYDAVAIVMADKWKWGKFKFIRICTDLVCVVLGGAIYVLSGGAWNEVFAIAGIGTIVTAFFMGPLIQFFKDKVAEPFLKK